MRFEASLLAVCAVSAMTLAQEPDRVRQLERRLGSALRQGGPAWTELLREELAGGPESLTVLTAALKQRGAALIERIESSGLRKGYDRLLEHRRELDRVRAHALELIYDEETYFYPYTPPAVSSEVAARYLEVQKEVDARVEAVRELWEDERGTVRISATIRRELEQLSLVNEALEEIGPPGADRWRGSAWLFSLPAEGSLTLRNLAVSRQEREQVILCGRIEAFNRAVSGQLSSAELTLLETLNSYRRMFGRTPLAINPKLLAAARSHAEEMVSLGYFSHFSPTPGRRTSKDRMEAEGYPGTGGENISYGRSSAQETHRGWERSSNHHRNLLEESYLECGIGNSGRHWVLVFGKAAEFSTAPEFPAERHR